MKVIFVNGSSHVNGTTMQAVKEMQKIFSAEGVESEVIQLGNQPIRDCIQCGYCGTHDACVFRDDAVNQFQRGRRLCLCDARLLRASERTHSGFP